MGKLHRDQRQYYQRSRWSWLSNEGTGSRYDNASAAEREDPSQRQMMAFGSNQAMLDAIVEGTYSPRGETEWLRDDNHTIDRSNIPWAGEWAIEIAGEACDNVTIEQGNGTILLEHFSTHSPGPHGMKHLFSPGSRPDSERMAGISQAGPTGASPSSGFWQKGQFELRMSDPASFEGVSVVESDEEQLETFTIRGKRL